MSAPKSVRDHCLAAGWIQGAVLRVEDASLVYDAASDAKPSVSNSEQDRLLVLTQDCDLVHHSLEEEPWVEVVPLRPIRTFEKDKHNGLLHGKSPRRLVFRIPNSAPEWWQIEVKDRFRFPRQALLGRTPDPDRSLPVSLAKEIARWVSRKYTRAAFADEFNYRLETQKKGLERLWKSDSATAISGIFIQGAREELAADETYQIKVLLAIGPEAKDEPQRYDQAEDVGTEFNSLLEACPGIKVLDLRVDPACDITLEDLWAYARMDKDYRSPYDNPGNARTPIESD
ncbi:MAG: hypothetical protein HY014_17650 [Acidobacteria bacterium]|nr:hypothetical protein [Acidobacteriota bacterium]MBI3489961.1 hypothetical protein [Acidobacteriota bacterium]